MHDDRRIIESRLKRVRSDFLTPAIWSPKVPFHVEMWTVPDDADGLVGEPVDITEALAATYSPSGPGTPWGRPWATTWFRVTATIPDEFDGRAVDAMLNLGFNTMAPGFMAEGLIWRETDSGEWVPERGLHPTNHTVRVSDAARAGDEVSYLVEAAANPLIWAADNPNSDRATAGTAPICFVGAIDLAVVDLDALALHHDLRAITGLMAELTWDGSRRWELIAAIDRSLDALDVEDVVGTAAAARAELAEVLARPAVPSAHRLSAVGHAHIDTAWLWPLRETERKVTRSFSNVLRLAEAEPEFKFACSQAAQYDWMRTRRPTVFADMQAAAERGQWIPVGGMWVEADGNVTGGESMARQFLHGQRFFQEHFGVRCTEVWIPDVFGYPAAFPQLFRLGGCDRFLTQKMSWNRTNKFPHHTFRWEGIDGSQVFTHFPPADNYNSLVEPFDLAKAERQYAEKGKGTRSMLLFGHGDGGGGPTGEMMERYRRFRDLEGLPTIEIESPSDFFDQAIEEYPDAPVWFGELYFEMHRGTYTSQARTKQGNRRCERLLREAELWSYAAFGGTEADGYPATQLDRLWKTVLVLQFHDILPGSSIEWVHREAEATYAECIAELEGLIAEALTRIATAEPTVVNTAPHARDEVVVCDPVGGLDAGDTGVQALSDGRVAFRVAVPAMGAAVAVPLPLDDPVAVWDDDDALVVDNGVLRVTIGADGCVSSLLHLRSGRETLAAGARGGMLQLHHDLPFEYDAWDIEEYYRRRVTDLDEVDSIEVLDRGPAVVRVRVSRSFRASTVALTYELRAGSPRLDVAVELDWSERDHLLKMAWPVDVHTGDVTRHIQYGHVRTAVHTNTSWDHARFEVCAHQWIDVGEPGFGVALLNDSRYGYDVTRTRGADESSSTTMRLTMVKGARFPDPHADEGRHTFTMAVMPHAGKFRKEGVVAEGYRLEVPLRRVGPVADDERRLAEPVVAVDHPAVVIEAVKAAEDGSGDLVVRCYESFGGKATTTVRFARDVLDVRLTDFLEDGAPPRPAPAIEVLDARTVRLSLRPFQIATLRVIN